MVTLYGLPGALLEPVLFAFFGVKVKRKYLSLYPTLSYIWWLLISLKLESMISSQQNIRGNPHPTAPARNTSTTDQDSNIYRKNVYTTTNLGEANTQNPVQSSFRHNGLMDAGIDESEMVPGSSRYIVDRSDAMSIFSVLSGRSGQRVPSMNRSPKGDSTRAPYPLHRHAIPSMPWPWIDLGDGELSFSLALPSPFNPVMRLITKIKRIELDLNRIQIGLPSIPDLCSHHPPECNSCWRGYPESFFPNWSPQQVTKSKLRDAIRNYNQENDCVVHKLDIDLNGIFSNPGAIVSRHGQYYEEDVWNALVEDNVFLLPGFYLLIFRINFLVNLVVL